MRVPSLKTLVTGALATAGLVFIVQLSFLLQSRAFKQEAVGQVVVVKELPIERHKEPKAAEVKSDQHDTEPIIEAPPGIPADAEDIPEKKPRRRGSAKRLKRQEKIVIPEHSSNTSRSIIVNQPLKVLLLAYQRTGSSFFGKFFDLKPYIFYVFEPLDAIYTQLYGTQPGWAVPQDIHYYLNGTYRDFPAFEQAEIERLLHEVFTCGFVNSTSELLGSVFWRSFRQEKIKPYASCLRKEKISISKCARLLRRQCPTRFGTTKLRKQLDCAKSLNSSNPSSRKVYKDYRNCTSALKQNVTTKCLKHLVNSCSIRRIKLIKSVRLEMKNVVNLFQRDPDFRVIHLLRDPRSVILSRLKLRWASHTSTLEAVNEIKKHGIERRSNISDEDNEDVQDAMNPPPVEENDDAAAGGKKDDSQDKVLAAVAKEAFLYCDLLARDLITTRRLPPEYRNRVHEVLFEDIVNEPEKTMQKLHEFLGEPFGGNQVDRDWLDAVNSKSSKSKGKDLKWINHLSLDMIDQVNKQCAYVYKHMSGQWPLTG